MFPVSKIDEGQCSAGCDFRIHISDDSHSSGQHKPAPVRFTSAMISNDLGWIVSARISSPQGEEPRCFLSPEMRGWSIKVNDEVDGKDLTAPREK